MDHTAQALLADFGRFVGLDELAFDENGYVNLSFDDVELSIEHMEDRDELLLYGDAGDIPPLPNGELYGKLLRANHAAAAAGLGTMGIDGASGKFVYLDRVALRGLTQQQFQDTVKAAIERIEFWRNALNGPFLSPDANGQLAEPPSDLSALIRI